MQDGSWVQQTAYGIVVYIIRSLAGEWSNQVWRWFSVLFSPPVEALSDPLVQRIVQISIGLALGFLPVAIGWTVIRETVARLDGSSTSPPEALMRRAFMAGLAVTGTSLAAWLLVMVADGSWQLLGAAGLNINLIQQFFQLPVNPASTVLFLLVAFLVGALLLVVQRAVIAAEFTVLLMIGPIMAAGLIRDGGTTTWSTWLRETVSLLITPLIQMLVMLVFLRKWATAAGSLETGTRLASLAFLYVLWKTPAWARQMLYMDTGAGATLGIVGGASRLVIMRQMIRSTMHG